VGTYEAKGVWEFRKEGRDIPSILIAPTKVKFLGRYSQKGKRNIIH